MCKMELKLLLVSTITYMRRCAVFIAINQCHKKNHNMYFNSSLNILGPHSPLLPFKAAVVKRATWSFCPNYIQDKVVHVGAASYVPSDTPL